MNHRIQQLKARLRDEKAEALLLTFLPDIRWACGFSGSNGVLLVREEKAYFLSDGRYESQAKREVEGAEVRIPGYKLFEYIQEERLLDGIETILFQSDHATVAQLEEWKDRFAGIAWKPVENVATRLVAAKDDTEIDRMRRAQQITEQVFDYVVEQVLVPGVTEKDVAAEIVYQHLKKGADKVSFDPIVASGPQGALPHARPSAREIQSGDLVVIDMGCFVNGYASDMTRTVAVGEPEEEAQHVYQVVLDAQKRAIEAAAAGMSSKDLDGVARQAIEQAGYGDYFNHGLGHGVGLQVHEWPRLSYHVDDELPERAAVTIEPGVYLPGRFGVRIEDMVVLHRDGVDNLTRAPKDELIVV